ncbi:probable CCR4-associated factor 1 homolog 11 [Mercurialis annua]|uniref:probable CCR4-associated factor 1 homolog 11 n=1 Tax=Mercurialis annua TaxID=3986 RepID=UPI00215FD30F|nr:probable CCR4-associated factor 1 homolog 11 [Mercurialis annua]
MLQKSVLLRQVWKNNLKYEFSLIKSCLPYFCVVSLDTEYPGSVYKSTIKKEFLSQASPQDIYSIMKRNVDELKVLQFGLTLSDANGTLPSFGTGFYYMWQFNFSDFDLERDLNDEESIKFLEKQGMDFKMLREKGIHSSEFIRLLVSTGLVMNRYSNLIWITFHGCYDLGFLVKLLSKKKLPDDIGSFLGLVRYYLGYRIYDLKLMSYFNGLYGGLEKIANLLNVCRVVGKSHQAGSDSLLTLQCFMTLMDVYAIGFNSFYYSGYVKRYCNGYEGLMYGLCQQIVTHNPPYS